MRSWDKDDDIKCSQTGRLLCSLAGQVIKRNAYGMLGGLARFCETKASYLGKFPVCFLTKTLFVLTIDAYETDDLLGYAFEAELGPKPAYQRHQWCYDDRCKLLWCLRCHHELPRVRYRIIYNRVLGLQHRFMEFLIMISKVLSALLYSLLFCMFSTV